MTPGRRPDNHHWHAERDAITSPAPHKEHSAAAPGITAMISYTAALQIIRTAIEPLPPVTAGASAALGQASSAAAVSAVAVPSFANAAMDGFALRAAETQQASAQRPARFHIAGTITAGEAPPGATPPGAAWEIMTGAPMPADCDAVVPLEKTEPVGGTDDICVRAPARAGDNRRLAGEDFTAGQVVLPAGALITPQALMALAATGCDTVPARPLPRIALIVTGNELSFTGRPAARGLIRDANGPYLAAALRELRLPVTWHESVRDSAEDLSRAIEKARQCADLILTTGGVSAGRLDVVPATVARLGGEVLFHKVAIRPGKPLLLARWPGGPCLFGLPGNPIAVVVGLRFFVMAALRALQGIAPEEFPWARCAGPVRKRTDLTFFAKAVAEVDREARLHVRLLPGQESFRIAPLLSANCWAIVPDGREDVAAGEVIRVAPMLPTPFPGAAA
jgi:molybdopterin molybdotransferase